eukprot:CAMPEP_0113285090 /NCGR_PEP_ID=MMETSP0008_2-20120614/30385_1 /TAXON_ID=97485 /ORGANISM="Prymnesium parvum" /LENGTH=63 /DNA_ID=CAMNT_0000136023 /DNA_START=1036 /DNA_END=1224 /DNA_ORIENTATION=- /assembly_acc=CAM_ASM_000153
MTEKHTGIDQHVALLQLSRLYQRITFEAEQHLIVNEWTDDRVYAIAQNLCVHLLVAMNVLELW